jgi:hypothetical protein
LHSDINVSDHQSHNLNILPVVLCADIHCPNLFITNQVGALSQSFNDKLVTLCPAVDVLDIISRGLEVAGGVVTLGDENVVIYSAFQGLIERDWGTLICQFLNQG